MERIDKLIQGLFLGAIFAYSAMSIAVGSYLSCSEKSKPESGVRGFVLTNTSRTSDVGFIIAFFAILLLLIIPILILFLRQQREGGLVTNGLTALAVFSIMLSFVAMLIFANNNEFIDGHVVFTGPSSSLNFLKFTYWSTTVIIHTIEVLLILSMLLD